MANLTAAAPLRFRYDNNLFIEKWVLDNSAAQTVYRGEPMVLDASEDTVYPRHWTTAITLANNDAFIGIALENKTVLTTDTETDNVIEVAGPGSVVGFKSAVFTDADAGKAVGFSDSGTLVAVAITGAADKCPVGHLLRVENGYAYIRLLDRPAIISGL